MTIDSNIKPGTQEECDALHAEGMNYDFQKIERLGQDIEIELEKDKYKYDGQEYQYIAFDEIQHFLHSQYKYMYSRARSTIPEIKPRIRASGMPIGVGIVWLLYIAGLFGHVIFPILRIILGIYFVVRNR